VCSRCLALCTECEYNAEEGESRWSTLSRRCRTLEREHDAARDLIAQMQSRPELEAREIYRHLRTKTHAGDLSALVREDTSAMSDCVLRQQPQQGQFYHYHQPEGKHENSQHQQPQQQLPQQELPQQQRLDAFFQCSDTATGSTHQLPPLRSIVEVPRASVNTTKQQQPSQPFAFLTQRNMSQTPAMLSDPYVALSLSAGHNGQSPFPKTNQLPG
jgi:hypothetical protein